MNIYSQFVETIKEYMTLRELNTTNFSKLINLQDRCVARWIDGTNNPSLEYLLLVADALNYSIDYLCGLSEDSNFVPEVPPSSFAIRLSELIEKFKVSKNKLANSIGVTSSTLSKYILHGHLPKPEIVYAFAQYFSCSMDYIVGRSKSI